MFSLFHGSEQKNAQLPPDRKVQPASPAVRARLMSLLKRSLVAANSFPDNLQVKPAIWVDLLLVSFCLSIAYRALQCKAGDSRVNIGSTSYKGTWENCTAITLQAIFACVFEVRGTLRLKHSGMEFAVWVFKHAAQEPLEHAAKPALQGLLMLLDNGATPTLCTPLVWTEVLSVLVGVYA